MTSHKLA